MPAPELAAAAPPPPRPAAEVALRVELACAYRAFALLGWEHAIHTHITVKVPGARPGEERFLINPYGLHWDEITAGSLVLVRAGGEVVDPGTTGLGINPAGFKIHSALHTSVRGKDGGDIVWTMHTHHRSTVAVGCTPQGVLPVSTFANDLGEVRYHDFAHPTAGDDVCRRLVEDLGPTSKVLILRNHGDITVGRTCAEAFFLMYNLHRATDVQVDAHACAGGGALIQPTPAALAENARIVRANYTGQPFGDLEWAAMRRRVEQRLGDGYKAPYNAAGTFVPRL